MSVGSQASAATVNQAITDLAVSLRDVLTKISNLSTWINGQGQGLTYLESLGFSASDATTAQNMISYLNTVAAIYFGTATQATDFNFNNALSQMWAGN